MHIHTLTNIVSTINTPGTSTPFR